MIADSGTPAYDEVLRSVLVRAAAQRTDLLAHAVRSVAPREPLKPLGVLSGARAIEMERLGSALYGLRPAGTGLTRAGVRERQAAWVADIGGQPGFARGRLLTRFGVRSGVGLPVMIGPRVVAVVEVLAFEPMQPESGLRQAFAALMVEARGAAIASAMDALSR